MADTMAQVEELKKINNVDSLILPSPDERFDSIEDTFTSTPGREAIQAFIQAHPGMETSLLASAPIIKDVFGSQIKPILIIVPDPESAENDGLMALIPMAGDIDTALHSLAVFRRWWYQQDLSSTGLLTFDVKMI